MTLMLFLLEKKTRMTILYMLIGQVICLLAAQMNYLLRDLFYGAEYNTYAVVVTITPLVEEFLKALPIIYFGFVISHKKEDLMNVSKGLQYEYQPSHLFEDPPKVGIQEYTY